MQITRKKTQLSATARRLRAAACACGTTALCLLAFLLHVRPVMAEEKAPAQNASKTITVTVDDAGRAAGGDAYRITAVAHGDKAKVGKKKGEYEHRWTGADGKPFVIVDNKKDEPTAETRKVIERSIARGLAAAPGVRMQMLQSDGGTLVLNLQNPVDAAAIRLQVEKAVNEADKGRKIALTVHAKDMAEAQKQLQKELDKIGDIHLELNVKDLAELKTLSALNEELNRGNQTLKGSMAQLAGGDWNLGELAQARQQLEEARKQLDASRKQLEEARKQLEESRRQLESSRTK